MSAADLPIPILIFIAIVVLYLLNSIKILREYERAVIFRLGRALPTPKGPGIILVFRPFDQMVRISLRQEVLEVPPQDVITRDNVTLKVNAVVTLYVVESQSTPPSRWPTTSTRPRSLRRPRCARCWARWNWTNCSAIATSSTCASRPSSTSAPSRSA